MRTFGTRDRLVHWAQRDRAFNTDPLTRDLEIGRIVVVGMACRGSTSCVLGGICVGTVAGVGGKPCRWMWEWRGVFAGMCGIVEELFEVDVGVMVCVSEPEVRIRT